MKEVERINTVIIGFVPRHNPYIMEMDCGRNFYNCGSFGHITRNYRN